MKENLSPGYESWLLKKSDPNFVSLLDPEGSRYQGKEQTKFEAKEKK